MKCYSCKKELPEGSAFCPYCGEKQGFDQETLDAAIAGDQAALADLYSRTYDSVYYTVRAMIRDEDTVLDLVQDSFVKAFQYLDRLQDPNKFRPWVKRIAHNLAVDYTRRNRPTLFSEMADEESEQILEFEDDRPESLPEVMLDRKESARLIREILGELSEDQRLVVAMYYYEQRSVRDIAGELGLSENTVKSRLFQSRKKIETRVRALEAQGTRLYSLSPVAFLLVLLRNQEQFLPPIPADSILDSVTRQLGEHAMRTGPAVSKGAARPLAEAARGSKQAAETVHSARTGAAVSKRAVEAAGHSVAHSTGAAAGAAAAHGVAAKVTALVAAAAVVLGGGAYAVHEVVSRRQPEPAAVVETMSPAFWDAPGTELGVEEPLTLDHIDRIDRGDMSVEYPVFRGAKSAEVNALVYEFAGKIFADWDNYYLNEYTGSYRCAVTLLNSRALSVVFWGETHAAEAIGARQGLRTLNLDLETMMSYELRDLYRADDPGFLAAVYAYGIYPGEPVTCFGNDSSFYDAFWDGCRASRDLDESFPYARCFLKPEGLVLSFYDEMAFPGCSHFEVMIRYEAIEAFRIDAAGSDEPLTEPLTLDHMETLHNMEMAVEYPVFRGEKSDEVNALVLDRAERLSSIEHPDFTQEQLSGEYHSAVTLLNDRVLSIAFWGWSYVEGGIHPFSNLFPLNLDLETMDTFTLSDLYDIEDPSFVSLCYANGRFPGSPETCFSEADYPDAFAYERDEYHALRYTEDGYLKPEGAVFTFPFMHATGSDHMEILVPYEALSSLYRGPFDRDALTGNREQPLVLSPELREAYLAKLRERERDIRYYAGKYGNTDGVCVAVCDVAGDDTPELLFITSQEGAGGDFLWIYGFEDGELRELAQIVWTPEADVVSMHCLYQQLDVKRPVAEASGQNGSGYWHTDLYYFPLEDGRLVQKRLAWSEGYNSGYYPVYDFDGLRLSEEEYELQLSEFRAGAGLVVLYDVRWGVDGRDALGMADLPCAAMRFDEAVHYLTPGFF